MRECRFFPWCSYIEDHGCTKDSCRHYQPMPDVDALLALAEEIEAGFRLECSTGPAHMVVDLVNIEMGKLAHRIREACGEVEPCDERS